MNPALIDTIAAHLEAALEKAALTDRACAAALQCYLQTGDFPDAIDDEASQALLQVIWLLFLVAPAHRARYLLLSTMHLRLVISEDRPLIALFDELRSGADQAPDTGDDQPQWLSDYTSLADPDAQQPPDASTLKSLIEQARQLLKDHHQEVLAYSQSLLNTLTEDFDRSVDAGVIASDLAPNHSQGLDLNAALTAATEAQTAGDLEAARAHYSAVLNADPDHQEARLNRGVIRAALEDLTGAIEDFDHLLEQTPDHLQGLLNRALARHSLGQVNAALDDYNSALKQVDDNAEIWANRGIAHFSAGDHGAALSDLNRALALDDQFVAAYLHRGNIRRVRKEVGHALSDYQTILEISPHHVDALAARAFLYLQVGEIEKAIADFDLALDHRTADPALYYNRAYAHMLNEQVDQAIDDYDRALALDPEDVETLTNRGAAKMIRGDLDGAAADWEEAIAIDPYYPNAYLKRAALWIATEQPDEAARDLQIALDNAPDNWEFRNDVEETLQGLLDEMGFDRPH